MDYTPIYHDIFYSQTYNVSVDSLGRLDCQQFFGIVEDLKGVNMFITAKKYKEAINLLDINIALLGNHYLSPTMDVSDDTGTKLTLGKIEQENGHWKTAAYLKRNVLESRVNLFQKMKNCHLNK